MRRLLVSLAVLCGLSSTACADPLSAPSFWKNQRGSELRIVSVNAKGEVKGFFTNYAEGYKCKGIKYPAKGRTTPFVTEFTVNFVKCRTTTIWRGTVQGQNMPTAWTLQHDGQTDAGFDFFYRIN
jgi:avidin family protein